jgi:hypothetical protein
VSYQLVVLETSLALVRFRMGERREEGESLALSSNLIYTRRTGGGRAGAKKWPHYNLLDEPRSTGRDVAFGRNRDCSWNEADAAIQAAHDAMRHQWRMEIPPPAPTRPRHWRPTFVSP